MVSNWRDFFSCGNEWDIDKINGIGYPEPLQSHLSKMLSYADSEKKPYVLPRLDASKQLWFYICSENSLQLNEVKSMVNAYLGSTYISLDPIEYKTTNDELEKIILQLSPHGFSRLFIPLANNGNKESIYWVFDSLNKLIQQYHDRPRLLHSIKRPVGTILRSFFTACKHGRGESAYECFLELKSQQSLSNRNLLSIELQALFASSKWNDILFHPKISDLLSGRVPRKLQSVLLKTIKEKLLNSYDIKNSDVDQIKHSLMLFQNLFFSPPDIPAVQAYADEWQSWIIGAGAFGYARVGQCSPAFIDNGWIHNIKEWAGLDVTAAEVTPDISNNSIDVLLLKSPSIDVATSLLQESIFAELLIREKIYKRLSAFPNELFDNLISKVPVLRVWQELEKEFSDCIDVSGWNEFFEYLTVNSNNKELKGFVQVVVQQQDYWDNTDVNIDKLNLSIQALSESSASVVLRDILPLFITWLEKYDVTVSADSLEHLMLTLVMDKNNSLEDLLLCNDLIALLLAQPHSKEQYIAMLDVVIECWENVESLSALDHCLEVFEFLYDSPCACKDIRLRFWTSIEQFAIQHWNRLSEVKKYVIRDISLTLVGSIEHLPKNSVSLLENPEVRKDLSGKRLAIYSLTETALKRASVIIQEMYPDLNIATNHDKTATEALNNLIRSSDYFIFAAKSAAHQAFYAITDKRKDLIYPQGKGSSSIVRCFEEVMESNVSIR